MHNPKQTPGKNNTECNGLIANNAGCGLTEWSRASYGLSFEAQGGGVSAMKMGRDVNIRLWVRIYL